MLSIMETILFLKRIPIFSNIHGEGLKRIADFTQEIVAEAGKTVFRENEMGDMLYIIKSGEIEIFKALANGQQKVLAVLHDQAFFGEMSLLDDAPRSASARATQDSTLLAISKDSFKEVVNEYPEIAFEIFKVFSQRLREANKEIQSLAERPVV